MSGPELTTVESPFIEQLIAIMQRCILPTARAIDRAQARHPCRPSIKDRRGSSVASALASPASRSNLLEGCVEHHISRVTAADARSRAYSLGARSH